MLHYLRTYEGRTKVFLVLLVFFIAAAVTVNFYLLMMSRDAVMAETAQRILLVGEAARMELRLTEGTVELHVTHLLRKCGAGGRGELASWFWSEL